MRLLGRKSGWNDLQKQLATFPASFPFDFACGKPERKVINGDRMTAVCCNVLITMVLPRPVQAPLIQWICISGATEALYIKIKFPCNCNKYSSYLKLLAISQTEN